MKVLLTGYTGLLGQAVARLLSDAGHELRVVVYRRAIRSDELPPDVELVWGDLGDLASLPKWVEGVDAVVHCAWDSRQDPPSRYLANNVDGAVELLHQAIHSGVGQFVHISSVAVYGMDQASGAPPFDEATPLIDDDDPVDIYPRTKAALERRLVSGAAGSDISLHTIRPGLLYDDVKAPAKRSVTIAGRRYALLFGRAGNHLPYIHVDVVSALVARCLASDDGAVTANAVPLPLLSAGDFVGTWARHQAPPVRVVRLPLYAARFLSLLGYRVKRLLGRSALRPNVSYQIATAVRDVTYDSSTARDLGWSDVRTAADSD